MRLNGLMAVLALSIALVACSNGNGTGSVAVPTSERTLEPASTSVQLGTTPPNGATIDSTQTPTVNLPPDLPYQNEVDVRDLAAGELVLPIPCGIPFELRALTYNALSYVAFFNVPDGTEFRTMQEGEQEVYRYRLDRDLSIFSRLGDATISHQFSSSSPDIANLSLYYAVSADGVPDAAVGSPQDGALAYGDPTPRGTVLGTIQGTLNSQLPELEGANLQVSAQRHILRDASGNEIDLGGFLDLTSEFVGCLP